MFPFELNAADENLVRTVDPDSTDPNVIHAALLHVGEGTDSGARREFRLFKSHQYLRKGVSVIHGVALAPDQIRELAHGGVGLIWSPHSNFILYGKTTDILTALDAGMTVALAPDWVQPAARGCSSCGVAYRYSQRRAEHADPEKMLVQMATLNPARLAKLDAQPDRSSREALPTLVMKRKGTTAYHAAAGQSGDVMLVAVGGVPLYGVAR